MFKTVKAIYKLINNPLTKLLFKAFVSVYFFVNKWIFTLIVGPFCLFVAKKSFCLAFKKLFPKMIKNYFTKTFPKVLGRLVKKTFPINMLIKFFD